MVIIEKEKSNLHSVVLELDTKFTVFNDVMNSVIEIECYLDHPQTYMSRNKDK